jgi:flagellar motility protein MotE (MotC chaperone)
VVPVDGKGATSAKNDAFTRLQRAYESMEPEAAAKALSELASRDREAVVALILGLKPRTSGAILDAVTQIDPALAADLSYAIWKRSGKGASPTARSGR